MIDFPTTVIILSAVNILSGLLLLFLYFAFRDVPSTKEWATGGLLVGLGCLLLVLRGAIPDFLSIVIANASIFFGYAFHYRGFSLASGNSKLLKVPFLISLALTAIFIVFNDATHLKIRIIFSSLGLIVLYLFLIHALVNKSIRINPVHKLLVLAFIFGAGSHLFRFVVYISQDIYEPNFIQTVQISNFAVFVTGSLLTIILTAGCSLLISLSLQTKLKDNIEKLKSESEEKSQFLAMFSHELKTPLAVLKTAISSRNIPPQFVEMANQSVREIDTIITSSQLADQIDSGAIEAQFENVSLKDLVSEIIEANDFKGAIKVHSQQSELAETDPFLLKIILKNLVDNACKYGKQEGEIILSISNDLDFDQWSITISNELVAGQTINREKIVEKYYREPSSLKKSGSGLGLYLVNGFAKMLNGTMNLEIDDTVFVVKLDFCRTSKS